MNIDETVKLLESQIAEANKLLAEIKKEKENKETTKSVLAEYWRCMNSEEPVYCVNPHNEVTKTLIAIGYDDNNTDHYSNYPTEEYAEQAQRIKEFNDKLLAFKWCYDRDYEPVFSGDYGNRACFVYYDSEDEKYAYDWDNTCDRNVIYFSSEEIAQKCCDWLNSLEEENNNG